MNGMQTIPIIVIFEYTSNLPGGSLTYSGIYSSFEAYNGRVVFYYST